MVEVNDFRDLVTFKPNKKIPIHNWYPFLQGFSRELVERFVDESKLKSDSTILDPFCGVGTTVLASRNLGFNSIGYDISPLSVIVSRAKMVNTINRKRAIATLEELLKIEPSKQDLPAHDIVLKTLEPRIAHRIVQIRKEIENIEDPSVRGILTAALISSIGKVSTLKKDGSHYRFIDTPESSDFGATFRENALRFIDDVSIIQQAEGSKVTWEVSLSDARNIPLDDESVDLIVTSPPYLNRNNYIAQNKLELFMMDCVSGMKSYRELTHSTLRSHVEAKYEDVGEYQHPLVKKHLNKLSTLPLNNAKIGEMIEGYFRDMNMVISELSRVTKSGGKCFFVVANSAWEGIYFETDKILSDMFINHGFDVEEIRITRLKNNSAQQIKKFGKIKIRESIIVANKRGRIDGSGNTGVQY